MSHDLSIREWHDVVVEYKYLSQQKGISWTQQTFAGWWTYCSFEHLQWKWVTFEGFQQRWFPESRRVGHLSPPHHFQTLQSTVQAGQQTGGSICINTIIWTVNGTIQCRTGSHHSYANRKFTQIHQNKPLNKFYLRILVFHVLYCMAW